MEISVELTFSPLQDNYKEAIIKFIQQLRLSGLVVIENPLSTQVYGKYEQVMSLLLKEIKEALEWIDNGVVFMKIIKSDRHEYKPYF